MQGDPKSERKKRNRGWELLKRGTWKIWQILQCGRKEQRKTDASTNYCQQNERDPHIHECSFEDLEIAELASQFHMRSACRFFKSIMHISP